MSLTAGSAPLAKAPERCILDDCLMFVSDHVAATEAQRTAMVLYASATHAMREHVSMGRLLFTSKAEASGKTLAMNVTASLSSAPLDASGTSYALQSALAAATNEPEKAPVTLWEDEISTVFGRSGLNGGGSKVADVLRRGYKRGATDSWSVNRVPEYYSVFTPFIMTGLRTAVPRDIRSRCIVIEMEQGTPRRYFDVREAEPFAALLAASLAGEVKRHAEAIGAFRALGLHRKMTGRKLEVWEPLMAVAYAVGGPRWLAKAVSAFAELALDASDVRALTPSEMVVRDVAGIAEGYRERTGEEFAGGLMLADELRHIGGPLYEGRSDASLACLVRDSVPLDSEQRRVSGRRVSGYPVSALAAAWEAVRPAAPADLEPEAEVNPFACDEDDEDDEDETPEAPLPPLPPLPPVTADTRRDVAAVAAAYRVRTGAEYIPTAALAAGLRELGGPAYAGRSNASLACLVRDAVPFESDQRRGADGRQRGYPVTSLTSLAAGRRL